VRALQRCQRLRLLLELPLERLQQTQRVKPASDPSVAACPRLHAHLVGKPRAPLHLLNLAAVFEVWRDEQ
jgi:hypothetical protein